MIHNYESSMNHHQFSKIHHFKINHFHQIDSIKLYIFFLNSQKENTHTE